MIDTSDLKEGEIVIVALASDESEGIEDLVMCKYNHGSFQNIEDNHHKYEVYGSSVVCYYRIQKIFDKVNTLKDEQFKKTIQARIEELEKGDKRIRNDWAKIIIEELEKLKEGIKYIK